jgi:hypothetical protein
MRRILFNRGLPGSTKQPLRRRMCLTAKNLDTDFQSGRKPEILLLDEIPAATYTHKRQ